MVAETDNQNEELLGALVEGTMMMLSMMFGVDGTVSDDATENGHVSVGSRIALSGPIRAEVLLSLPRTSASTFVATMVACDPGDVADELLADGVGEMINIIAGNAKAALARSEWYLELAIPEAATHDEAHSFRGLAGSAVRRIDTALGPIELAVRHVGGERAEPA